MNALPQVLSQVGRLKTLKRAGWVRKGLSDAESVADHSHRTAILALLLGNDLGVDRDRLVALALVHDLAESDPAVGDITPDSGIDRREKQRKEREAMERLAAVIPHGKPLLDIWIEYDEAQTPEARAAHEIDALEMALQAHEYESTHGIDLAEFRSSARAKITHPRLLGLLDQLENSVGPSIHSPP